MVYEAAAMRRGKGTHLIPLSILSHACIQACGHDYAHVMAIFSAYDDMLGLDYGGEALTVQEYVNHGGTIYKVYVVGGEKHVVMRASLRCNIWNPKPWLDPILLLTNP